MRKFFWWVGIVGFLAIQTLASMKVTEISVNDANPQSPFVLIKLQGHHSPILEKIDDETFVVHFPVATQWATKRSEVFGGLIKSFTYVPYEDGTGDLVFKTSPALQLVQGGMLKDNSYGLAFRQKAALNPTQPTFIIRDVKVGQKEGKTRLVIEMSEVVNFTLKENKEGSKIILTPTQKPLWQPKLFLTHPIGRFEKYQVKDTGKELSIELSVVPGTIISNIRLADGKTKAPKIILDLGTGVNAEPEIDLITNVPRASEDDASTNVPTRPLKGLIKKLDFINQEDDTVVRLETNSPQDFEVIENHYMSQAVIQIPKTDWKDVAVPRKYAGLIQGFRVDQTSRDSTQIILNLQKGTAVTGKKVFKGDNGLYRFVVYFNQNENKTPSWLVEQTTEQTPYKKQDLEVAETSRLMHRGGISPYTNLGEGFYVGLQLDQLATENTSSSLNSSTHRSRELAVNNFGGGGHLYLGYGITYDRLYGGLELRVGGYGAEEKDRNEASTGIFNSTSRIGLSWDISTRLGGYISPTTLLYARLGVVSTSFSYSGSSNANGSLIFPGSFTKNSRTGFLYGAGLESAVNDQASVRLEGAQINYQGIRYNNANSSITKKDRNIFNQISVGLSYKPSPMAGPPLDKFYEESVNTGFYFGLAAGIGNALNMREVDGKDAGGASSKYTSQSGSSEPAWEGFGGYSYNYGRFFVGTEFQLGLNPTLVQESISNAGSSTETYSNKLKWLWALTARPGYIFNHGTIGYGRLGIVGGSLVHKAAFSSAARQFTSGPNMTKHILGVRTGGGLEVFMTPDFSIRADYTFDYFPRVVFKDPTINGVEEKIALINNEFKIGVAYSLPS